MDKSFQKEGFDKDTLTQLCNAINKGFAEIVKLIKDLLSADQWYELLQMTKLEAHLTPLQIAADEGHTEIVKLINDSLSTDQWYKLLQTAAKLDRYTPLYIAADRGHKEIVKLIKVSLSTDQWYELLQMTTPEAHLTPLFIAAYDCQTEIVRIIKDSLSTDQWYKLLQTSTWWGHNTPLHIAAERGHTEIVKLIKASLSTDQWYKLNQTSTGWDQKTPLYIAVDGGHTEIVKLIKDSLSTDQWYKLNQKAIQRFNSSSLLLINYINGVLLQKASTNGAGSDTGLLVFSVIKDYFLLHMLAQSDDLANISSLLCKLEDKQRLEALALKDANGKTPYQIASTAAVKSLLRWTKDQTGFYLLPTPPAILIIYSTDERPGYEEEYNALSVVLPEFNVSPTVKKDLTRKEMLGAIREAQGQSDDLSALIVIIMAHGQKGAVQASDGLLDINEILLTMNSRRLDGKPKVLLIQACQHKPSQMASQPLRTYNSHHEAKSDADGELDARSSQNVTDTNHFDIKHSDFMVLMATINGSRAERNMMIPLFAANLSKSGEHEDLYEVFLKTNREMALTSNQVPEFRSTLKYKLSLRNAFDPNARSSFLTSLRHRFF